MDTWDLNYGTCVLHWSSAGDDVNAGRNSPCHSSALNKPTLGNTELSCLAAKGGLFYVVGAHVAVIRSICPVSLAHEWRLTSHG